MPFEEKYCPLCGKVAHIVRLTDRDAWQIACRCCGTFCITWRLWSTLDVSHIGEDDIRLFRFLPAYTRQTSAQGTISVLDLDDWREKARRHQATSVPQKIRKLLRLIEERSAHLGEQVTIEAEYDYPLINAASAGEFETFLDDLSHKGYVRYNHERADVYHVGITIAGKEHLDTLLAEQGARMPFENLTDRQRTLLTTLVEKIASGNYDAEFWATSALSRPWSITLYGLEGTPNQEMGDFSESDLQALEREKYALFVSQARGAYRIAFTEKAFREYRMPRPHPMSMEIMRKFQRALRNRDFSEVNDLSFDDLLLAKADLRSDRDMEYYQLLLEKIREKELKKNIGGTTFNISNAAIGVLNAGEIEDVGSISVHVSFLHEAGEVKAARALEHLATAVVASTDMSAEQKEEALELLDTLGGQAALPEEKRLKPRVIGTLLGALAQGMSAAGGAAEVWAMWGPVIKAFFGF